MDRYIKESECKLLTSLSRTTRWRLSAKGEFPGRYVISPGRSAYRLSEVEAWIRGEWKNRRAKSQRTNTDLLVEEDVPVYLIIGRLQHQIVKFWLAQPSSKFLRRPHAGCAFTAQSVAVAASQTYST